MSKWAEWAEWVEIPWGFTKFNFKQMLKVSAFYLEKKQNIPKNIFFKPKSLNVPRYIQKMALAVLIFSEGFACADKTSLIFPSSPSEGKVHVLAKCNQSPFLFSNIFVALSYFQSWSRKKNKNSNQAFHYLVSRV